MSGTRGPPALERPAGGPVDLELAARVIVLGRVFDVGEVGGQALDDEAGPLADVPDEGREVLRRDALAPGPGLQLDVDADGLTEPGGQIAEPGDRLPVVDGEAQVPDDGLFEGGERRVSEDEDGRADAGPAQRGALVDGVDAEPVDALVDGDRGDLEDAVTVGVGLDDGQELPLRPDEAAELADVVGQGPPADLDPFDRRASHVRSSPPSDARGRADLDRVDDPPQLLVDEDGLAALDARRDDGHLGLDEVLEDARRNRRRPAAAPPARRPREWTRASPAGSDTRARPPRGSRARPESS